MQAKFAFFDNLLHKWASTTFSMSLHRIAGLTFDSQLEGGNCARVELSPDGSGDKFSIWLAADCEGTPHATRHRAWFLFSVAGGTPGREITITVENMSKMAGLYRDGMCPVYRIGDGRAGGGTGGSEPTSSPTRRS